VCDKRILIMGVHMIWIYSLRIPYFIFFLCPSVCIFFSHIHETIIVIRDTVWTSTCLQYFLIFFLEKSSWWTPDIYSQYTVFCLFLFCWAIAIILNNSEIHPSQSLQLTSINRIISCLSSLFAKFWNQHHDDRFVFSKE